MSINFYKLKYMVIESFYMEVFEGGLDYQSAAGKTYYTFTEEMRNNGIEKIIIVITVFKRMYKHKVIDRYQLNYIKEIIDLYNCVEVEDIGLKEEDYRVLSEEICELRKKLNV